MMLPLAAPSERSRAEVVSLLEALVAIDSTNPDLADGPGESQIAYFIAGWLADRGLDVELVEPVPGRPSVLARRRGSGTGPTLLLNGHIDTVGPGAMRTPHTPRTIGDRLYGRGAFDMKAGVAAMMLASTEVDTCGDVVVAAVADEESQSIGTRAVLERVSANGAIVCEPTGLGVCIGHKGFTWAEIAVTGVAAHGSRSDLGVDAIMAAGRAIAVLEEVARRWAAQPDPVLGPPTLHCSTAQGGRELSTYPESCVLTVEFRTVPWVTPARLEAALEEAAQAVRAYDPRVRVEWSRSLARPPFRGRVDDRLTEIALDETSTGLRRAARPRGQAYWTDAALLAEAGIATVVLGPGGEGAHADVEWASIADVDRCRTLLAAIARRFCAAD